MRIAILDITGRTADKYDLYLCRALAKQGNDDVISLITTLRPNIVEPYNYVQLLRLVPKKYSGSVSRIKRILRGIETTINYLYLVIYLKVTKTDVLHVQWLPFIDVSSLDLFYLRIIKLFNRNLRVFLTVHNIYPHDYPVENRPKYKERFIKVDKYINGYFVHLNSTKNELRDEFTVPEDKIHITYHGIFTNNISCAKSERKNKEIKQIILYGYQYEYKGADILIKALSLLPDAYLQRTKTIIIGKTEPYYYDMYKDELGKLNIEWITDYVSDEKLNSSIINSDLILLPYRRISQSGALLLALSYHKPIITSDLPSFRETMDGYPDDFFFKTESTEALAKILMRYLDGELDETLMCSVIDNLNQKYSWEETAKSTLRAYDIKL